MDERKIARDIEVGIVVHAIRLGKRPPVGVVIEANLQFTEVDEDAGVVSATEKVPVAVVVTQQLLDEADAAINAQRTGYREPKTSILSVDGGPVPERIWKAAGHIVKKGKTTQ